MKKVTAAVFAFVLFCSIGAVFAGEAKKDIEVMVVYYPHWHEYPKGDEWFHKGWKEWEFVEDSKPRWRGHKIPMRPLTGYLDGANPKDVEKEIALASNAGIDVFLYDYYYYNGQITQEEAIEKGFLKAANRHRMKFALMWCYHERRDQFRPKVAKDRRMLMELAHTPEEFLGLIDHSIKNYFNKPEYWRKDGKLFFSIYNLPYLYEKWGRDVEKIKSALDEARRRVRAAGLGELHLNAQGVRPRHLEFAEKLGLDSLTDYNFGPWITPDYSRRYNKEGVRLFDYAALGEPMFNHWRKMQQGKLPYIPNVATGWDATSRCDPAVKFPWGKDWEYPYCASFTNNTADIFRAYLQKAKEQVLNDPKNPGVVYINGWNEYTEGTYLLPNNFETDEFLRAIASVFGRKPANEYTYVNPSTKQMFTIPAATYENVPYGKHVKQKVDVFLPKNTEGKVPVVIYIHGGGWGSGAMEDAIIGSSIRSLLDRGIAVVGTGYRYLRDASLDGVKPSVKGCLDDAEAAVKFVKANADKWGIDTSRIALAGGSAGACTALYLGLKDDNSLGIKALGPVIAQTSIDPKQMKEWIPNIKYGQHAFGFRSFDEWLTSRNKVLPWIEKFSPAALAEKIDAKKAPVIFLEYGSVPKPGELAGDPTHSGTFGVKFKEICDRRGIKCEVFSGKKASFGETFDRLADVLLK